ncbi:MAG: SusC/RagA family TonB-linked outer membrane protein [Prevotella sp.]|nr:SusC/RagA family TonB-linked outer membrane protein [Prevotella sp.]
MTLKKLLLTALMAVVCQGLMAQGVRISGTLSDNEGPVMMGNVVERDANNRIVSATQTDFNGNFSMQIKNTKNKLVFSYVGDKTKVVNIGTQTVFKITLEPENTQLKEVKVVGRRNNSGGLMMQKKEITTASQTMSMESVEGLAFTSADEALQGEIAGLDIVSNSGNLGAGTTMRLRGVTTITGDANPLIVVDDKIFDNPDDNFDFQNADEEAYASLLSVNVEDIAKIEVLKDAAATAVWGSKGSNGVLLITTKRGSRGKPRVNFSYKFTGTWQPKGYTLLNGDDYTMLMKEEFYNPSQLSTATSNINELNYKTSWAEYENWNNNTDWVDAVTQFGGMHDFNVNLTGGGQKATFRISAGYKHQSGTVIKQKFQQFTTRMVLDYNVSDRIRFSTNFALTYTGNNKNYGNNILSLAQKMAPNMSIYRQDDRGNDTDEYYIMNPYESGRIPDEGNVSSYELRAIYGLGNPVAIANVAWAKENTYRLTPDFNIKYELLGVEAEKSRLTLNGRVDFDIYANSSPTYYPASLSSQKWSGTNDYNLAVGTESNRFKVGGRVELVFTPYFKNQDWSATMLARYEMSTQRYNSQTVKMNDLPPGITTSTVYAGLSSGGNMGSSNSRAASQNLLYNGHVSYKDGRYNLGFSLRADGDSKFGPKHKWAMFPGVSLRYNISDEPFFQPIKGNWLSLFGIRASWGIVGKAPSSLQSFYNTYNTSTAGYYGFYIPSEAMMPTGSLDGLKLDDLKWEKTTSYNLGFNLGLLNDRIEVDFDYYHKETRDLLMSGVAIPSMVGYSSLSYINAGRMDNDGWELNFSAKKIINAGKFSVDASFNVAQNANLLKSMDQSVLDALNNYATVYGTGKTTGTWTVTDRGNWPLRVQLNNSLGSIYGFRNLGVYQCSYDYLENLQKENNWDAATYEAEINKRLAAGQTFPIVTDKDGNVLMDSQGHPMRMVYNYTSSNGTGSTTYTFQGGDAIYEDVNNDGQINELDVVYLGNSLPKVNGGFNLTFKYGNWSVKTRFMYRFGNKVVNLARQNLEKMFDTYNQCATVNYRWRQDEQNTPIPRAMYNTAYNFQPSDRFVEDGGFVRFQNLQIAYNFPKKMIKDWGLNQLQAYASLNNLYVWTKYSGVDPEISPQGYGVAADASQTPRSKQFTVTLNIGF